MSNISPSRPTRRAAASRRKLVAESSDEDELNGGAPEVDSEEDFTPAPRTPQRQSRRKTTNITATTPRTGIRSRRAKTGENIEPTELFDHEASSVAPESTSPTKRPSPRKRKSTAVPKSRTSRVPSLAPLLPTPEASVSPEPQQSPGTPLADITSNAINETPVMVDVKWGPSKIRPVETELPKPMDIVLKSRSTVIPVPEEPSGPKARMVIQYLYLINFKSYAGRQQVGPFHASFSSVVGPNGSGKSNVIDSLLFVFGFRASKMRQGKISALIHNSAQFPDLDHCEVEVHFQEVMDLVSKTS